MFFFKLKDGRTINLDQIVTIAPLDSSIHGVRIVMSTGTMLTIVGEDWDDMEHLLESYSYHKELN